VKLDPRVRRTDNDRSRHRDWTVGIKLGVDKNGGYWLLDMVRGRANPGDVDRLLLNTAEQDGKPVRIGFGKDPGQAGKSQALHLVRAFSGFTVTAAQSVATSSRGSGRSVRSAAPAM
jgi:phage terminase large subunit-like protein